jgi:hypothetical protein
MTRTHLRISVLSAGLLLAMAAGGVTFQASPAAQGGRGGGEPVVIEFLALGRDGQPVTDLKADEVQLRVGGRQRTVRSLDLVQSSEAPSGEAAKPAGPALPPPFGTNVAAGGGAGRLFFFLIEDQSLRPGTERPMKDAIEQFLGTVPATDRVALVTVPQTTVRVDPTTSRDEIREALAKVSGHAVQTQNRGELACRTRDMLEATRNLMSSLAGVDVSTTAIVMSAGLLAATSQTANIGQTGSGCDLTTDHFQNVGRAVSAANARLYVVQADDTVAQQNDGLEALAGATGAGPIVRLTTGDNPLSRVARETSASWKLAFDPEPSERNGSGHRVDLRVTRADVAVRVPPEVVIAKADARGAKPMRPQDMLRVPTVFRDLPLRVVAYSSRDQGDKLRVLAVGEPVDPGVKLTAAAAALYDASGKGTQWTARSEDLATMPLMAALVAAPGKYRLRLAATDSSGRTGTADYDVEVALITAGEIKLSGLVLGTAGPAGFRPALQFSDEPEAIAYFELYGRPTGQLGAKLEVAKTEDGEAIAAVGIGAAATSEPDRFQLTGKIPLAELAPGDYIVRAIVGVQGQAEGRILRTLRKVAK